MTISSNVGAMLRRGPGREPVVDGVRAIAILWVFLLHVVFFHFSQFPNEVAGIFTGTFTMWTRQGLLGVDLFFVISGYLIGTILLKERRETGTIELRRFYARRFLRLIPVYVVVMLLAAPFLQGVTLVGDSEYGNFENAWANLLYVNNFLSIADQYMGWCWSLAIEEQFYLVAPLFLLCVLAWSRRPLVWMSLLMVASVLIRFGLTHHHELAPPHTAAPFSPEWVFYFDTIYDKPYVRYGGLLAGVIGAYVALFHRERLDRLLASAMRSTVLGLLAIAGLVGVTMLSFGSDQFAGVSPMLGEWAYALHRDVFSIAAMLLILVAIHGRGALATATSRVLSARLLYPVAQLSYSTYLVHEVVMIWVFPRTAPVFAEQWGFGAMGAIVANGVLSVLLTGLIAGALFVFVERPSMEFRRSVAFRRLAGA